jgi:hypothetical protein
VPEDDAISQARRKTTFKKGSPSHKAFIMICEAMKWDVLPRSHKKLKEFQEEYGYNRNQIRRKFNEWKAEVSGLADTELTIDHASLEFFIPETYALLGTLKQQDCFRHISAIAPENTVSEIICMIDFWDKIRSDIVNSLKTSLIGVKRFSQWKKHAKLYAEKKSQIIINSPREVAPLDETAYVYISVVQNLMFPFVLLIEKAATTSSCSNMAELVKSIMFCVIG